MTAQRTSTGDLAAALEALLFVADRPLATGDLADLVEAPAGTVTAALGTLAETLEGRGIRLQQLDDAWQLTTAPEVADRVRRYAERTEGRLSPAAVEALAVVAYRQPATRGDVERVRGVDSESVMRSLLHRRLITEAGRRDSPGRPILYRTTFTFLERFGMESLEELPALDVPPDPGPASAMASAEGDEVDEAAEREVAADRHAG
ncbi:MAG TPA: SMC-Scp complex subunit ScpB [Candidatus Limnocylindria bacterium]|nr:SMC-Scp complex subunit ScpB [Candidatus Limnocylindria bacterium]